MQWQEVCEHPSLKNLPFKIELDEYGKILMSPVKVYHSAFQGEIAFILRSLLKTGRTLPECAIKTSKGTKVADVAWASLELFQIIKEQTECSVAPEICVEVISASNSQREIDEKKALYFEAGAKEFWTCNENGVLKFFSPETQLSASVLVPNFPVKIEW
ncbi:MAG: hypothetical protein methR_P0361 [Methyloprofundus sp.]|nr:MAG: hypothetical protein methR_P0361 [Methyloprofundus sp.]